MATTATFAGHTILAGAVRVPAWGVWWADVEVDAAVVSAGPVALEVAGLSLSGAIVAGSPWAGRTRYRVAGGAGRWGVEVPARSYANDLGVKLATVLGDAAAECGETLETIPPGLVVGPQWAREAGPASRQLALLAPQAWHVDALGTTRLGRWPASVYAAQVTVLDRDDAHGRYEIAAEDLAGLVPGARVAEVDAVDVEHRVTPTGTRTTVWTASDGMPRVAGALGALVRALTTEHRYSALWPYRVVAQSGERLDLQVERVASGMPDLQHVPVRLSPGVRAAWLPGSMCLVAFVAGSPSRPVVVAGDDPSADGWLPTTLTLDAGALNFGGALAAVLRSGELVNLAGVQAGAGVTGVVLTANVGTFPPFGLSRVKA